MLSNLRRVVALGSPFDVEKSLGLGVFARDPPCRTPSLSTKIIVENPKLSIMHQNQAR